MNTKALRQKVLDLAIHGKLVPQNPNDESATVLLEKIRAEKAEKIKKGELKADKKDSFIFVGSDKRHYEQFADGTVKDIEDEIPFDVPEGWAWCRLGTLSETTDYIANGSFADTRANVKFYKEKNYALLVKTQDFNNNFTDDLTYTDETGYNFLSKSHLFGGELLLSNIGASIGKALIVPKFDIPMAVAPNSIVVRTTDLLETQFLKSIMLSTYGQNALVAFTAGSAMPKFNKTQLRSLLIPLPTIYAQQSIISTVNTIFETIQVIENDKDELENLIKHTKSKILDLAIHGKLVPQDPNDEPAEELLKRIATSDNRPYKKLSGDEIPFELPKTWIWQKLPDLCSIPITDGTHKTPTYSDKENGIPFLSSKDVTSGEIDWSKIKYITKELHEELYKRLAPQKNDILLAKNGTTGIAALVKDNTVFDIYVTLALIRPISKIIYPQYLLYIINSQFCKNQFNDHLTGIGVPNLHLVDINKTVIPLPPLSEQQRIVLKIEELFEYTDIINISIKEF